jgi:hypothetical protein
MMEEVELLGRQDHDLTADGHIAGRRVESETIERERLVTTVAGSNGAVRSAQQVANAHGEFTGRERLHHVVVGTELESDDTVDLLGAGGEQHDRHVALVAYRAEDGETVHTWQHHVEDDKSGIVGRQPGDCGVAVAGLVHAMAVKLEVPGDDLEDHRLVVDDQNQSGARGGHGAIVRMERLAEQRVGAEFRDR